MVNKIINVVIPAFNEERLFPQCLESLKNQNYPGKCEVIVVDNASTDSTARVAGEFGAKVVFCPRRGVVYARQAGAQVASGDIIVQGDADTVYPKDWLSRIARHFVSHPRSVALAGSFVYKDPPRWARIEYLGRYLINIIGLLILGRPVYISGANFAFRREAFLKTNGYNPTSLYPDQWGISRSLSRVGEIYYDSTLLVATSTRRVQKPFYSILCDIVFNSSRIFAHFIKHITHVFRKPTITIPKLRTSARRATSMFLVITICLLIYGYIALKLTAYNQ